MTQLAEPADTASATLPSVGHWIGGHQVAGTSGRRGPVFDPATGTQAKWVDFASVEEMDAAVAAAKAAFPAWRATSLSKRTEILFKIRNLVDTHRRDLAALLTAEHGKVPSDALGEIARGLENLEFACGVPHLLKGGFSEQASTGVDVYQIRQPLGVVAGITPFNFPAMVPMWMFANAIACGNTFILKPSEKDPSASLFMAELHARGRRAGRRVQRRPGRQGRGRPDPRPPGRRRRVVRRLDPDRALHLRDRHPQRQARPGAGRREEPHARAARRRRRHGGRRRRVRGLRLVGRAVHGDRDRGRGRRRGGPAGRGDRGAPAEDPGRPRHGPGRRDGAARHPRASRQGRLVPRQRGRAGRDARRRRPRAPAVRRRRLLPGLFADRQRQARDGRLPQRDLRAGAGGRSRRDATRRP